jgi:excisionase family DNA binding protein
VTERDLVRTGEAARALNVSSATLRAAANDGRLQPAAYTPGGHYLWDLDDLRRQVEQAEASRRRGRRPAPKPDTL